MSKKNWNATQREAAANNNSEKLLAAIAAKIEERNRAAYNGERNWGHAGDANHLQNRLLDLVMSWELGDDESEADCRDRILKNL